MSGVVAAVAEEGVHSALPDARRKGMAVRGFMAQNVAIGSAFGTFSVALLPLQEHYNAGRGIVTMGLAVAMLAMGLSGPLVAHLMARIGIRGTMLTGLALSIVGYVLLAFAPNIWVVLLAYGLPVGLGMTMMGPIPASVLAARWFPHNPGPAVGFVNMPVLLIFIPIASVPLLSHFGLTGMYLAIAALHVLFLPVLTGIVEGPEGTGGAAAHAADKEVPARQIIARPVFWAVVVAAGTLNAMGIISSSNIVALGIERGISPDTAALLASVQGLASVAGAYAAGLICARIGGAGTLSLIAFTVAIGWGVLSFAQGFALIAGMTLLLGAGGAGVFPAVNVLSAEAFGASAVARTLGLFTTATLPFTFVVPPIAGAVVDAAGNYLPVILASAAASLGVAAITLTMARLRRASALN